MAGFWKAGSRTQLARQTVGAAPTHRGWTVENAVWSYKHPNPGIAGFLALYRNPMDGWSEEDTPPD